MKKIIPIHLLKWLFVYSIAVCSFYFSSCKKLVDITPPTDRIADNNVYTTDVTAISVLTGIYVTMNSSGPFSGTKSINLLAGLSADELTLYDVTIGPAQYYKNTLSALPPASGSEQWSLLYNYILKCNAAVEGLNSNGANALTPLIKQQLLGEAKFMRGFFYFYLVNLFGDVPLALTSDPKSNAILARAAKEQVYQQIIKDIKDAESLLNSDFLDVTLLNDSPERVRPSKWAAAALLARVYLYTADWEKAEEESTKLISNKTLFNLSPLANTFLKVSLGNKEAIWQLQPTALYFNTQEAINFIIPSTGPNAGSQPVYLSGQLLSSFETNDLRAKTKNWIDTIRVAGITYKFPYKYKINANDTSINAKTGTSNMREFFTVLRLAEQYLIRAEARAQQGNLMGAITDLDSVRNRAGLPLIANVNPGISQTALLDKILHERQVELFCESGHRWLDLKRTGKVNEVMSVVTPLKANGAPWQSYQQLYPLPQSDLDKAPNLKQNPGYN